MERLYIIPIKVDQQQKVEQITSRFKYKIYYITFAGSFNYFNFTSNKTGNSYGNTLLPIYTIKTINSWKWTTNVIRLYKVWEVNPYEDFTIEVDTPDPNGVITFIGLKEDV